MAMLIKNAIAKLVEQEGYNIKTSSNEQKIAEYTSFYKGQIDKFHTYDEFVNGKKQRFTRKSSQTGKMVSEDWASILWSENVLLKHSNETADKAIEETLKKNNFQVMFGHAIEYAFGQSEHLLYEFFDGNDVWINFINIHNYVVLDHWNGIPTVVFGWEEDKLVWTDENGKDYIMKVVKTILFTWSDMKTTAMKTRFYRLTEKNRMSMSPINMAEIDANFIEDWSKPSVRPHFQVVKPNVANNHDFSELRGSAIHANAGDDIKTIDIISTGYEWEYVSGENKVIVTAEAVDKDLDLDTGAYTTYFDVTKKTYMVAEGLDKSPVNVVQFELRADDFDKGMNRFYSEVARRCGLGPDYYYFHEGKVYKNKEEILSSRGPLWRNKLKHEQILKFVLESVSTSILMLKGISVSAEDKLTIKFDDSLITDRDKERKDSMEDVERGFKPKWKHLLKYDPDVNTEEEAKALATELDAGQVIQDMNLLNIN